MTPPAGSTPTQPQGKRSRFHVMNIEGKPGDVNSGLETCGSSHSSPNTSPSGSLSRGQGGLMDVQGVSSVYTHLETLYRQNEQQRAILSELFTGLGLKTGVAATTGPDMSQTAIPAGTAIAAIANSTATRQEGAGSSQSIERQLQLTVRENESLRRENEALKRELDRLRRGV
ncbi:hypothetical protein BCR41DRAFT_179661 [Lobosporangium transversale]|uniref:Uncharacterized protein n=1 Tax=Lobosporangium transversale TaxID=64571 RepID=A0A1Y2GYY8_9FUNG|nr:hypothetical protein BCR41DRAFT_179661 [Lobosporangium transversale]ORZ26981.1 hypothetical protein BCR41DRAFT_179661 [Lobosporangium transversale]|eukprot:XP_021884728.1 hypothetical protein BCR41DRAFT_179661 [Lobosporangium transversale]